MPGVSPGDDVACANRNFGGNGCICNRADKGETRQTAKIRALS